jgi:hypothetical protein
MVPMMDETRIEGDSSGNVLIEHQGRGSAAWVGTPGEGVCFKPPGFPAGRRDTPRRHFLQTTEELLNPVSVVRG